MTGGWVGAQVSRSEEELRPGPEVNLDGAVRAYRERTTATDALVRSLDLTEPSDPDGWGQGKDVRWVLLHLINANGATRGSRRRRPESCFDGKTGE